MSDTTLSDLTATTTPSSSDLVYVVDGGASRQSTIGNLSKGVVVTNLDVTGLTAGQLVQVNSGGTAIESSGITATVAEINVLDGITATVAELNYTDGVTSAIQTQLNAKAASSDLTTHMSDTTTHGVTGNIVGISDTQTLTNKRITKRITTIVSHATPTINTDNCDCVTITAQAEAITSMTTNLSGTPTNFQPLIIRIKDDGTGRAITWGTSFEAMGVSLPTTTTASKVLTVGFLYNTVTSKWGCVASAEET